MNDIHAFPFHEVTDQAALRDLRAEMHEHAAGDVRHASGKHATQPVHGAVERCIWRKMQPVCVMRKFVRQLFAVARVGDEMHVFSAGQ
ncbi:hypothetical protein [Bradyrhizobium sp.]|uniref:hypothetical protein n=1 Tax=Bradyrhizobium sp. TaxID=376 RepID=UPI002902610A|nr:hypothetical protein [Bradyrhizobium sp.]MDU0955080.1 hypothetical protein [Bradyrhizobium sp.]MDU1689735.1 hypothetical protein [Bradyrhizobium sp.]MDU3039782.1 hypothetical protein [Bradyrhizobium sp.]MDU3091966.1 hypothetical protein [Bradyrhizobium sp.]MDU3126096.1 hypothetical protein [Bradyrhizobium sp.]